MKEEEPACSPTEMAVASKAVSVSVSVSKRSARPFEEDSNQNQNHEYHTKKVEVRFDDAKMEPAEKHQIVTSYSMSSASSTTEEDFDTSSLARDDVQIDDLGFRDLARKELPLPKDYGLRTDGLSTHPLPLNFGVVVPGVYRSSYPQLKDHLYMKDLGLKTIITLVQKALPDGYQSFMDANNIRHVVIQMTGTKKEEIPIKTMKSILRLVLDQQFHPLLIHCNHGKHRTGCVVAIVRKVSGWDLPTIIDEYKAYATPKVRECDVRYIAAFELSTLSNLFVREHNWRWRVRNFTRFAAFSLCVLFLWMVSGMGMVADRRGGV